MGQKWGQVDGAKQSIASFCINLLIFWGQKRQCRKRARLSLRKCIPECRSSKLKSYLEVLYSITSASGRAEVLATEGGQNVFLNTAVLRGERMSGID